MSIRIIASAVLVVIMSAASASAQVCGNALVEPPETCDDGNLVGGDGCSALCLLENLPPDCTAAAASAVDLWPPNHRLVPLTVLGVVDPDGDPVLITVTGVAQDEPVDATGDGDTCPDAEGVGTATASVRVERSGQGDGRVYHVAFTADDGRGGACIGTVIACVRHDGRPGGVCGDQGPLYDSVAADPAVCAGCDLGDCVPGGEDLDDCAEAVPGVVARRTARASKLLARADEAGPGRRSARLARKAAKLLGRAADAARTGADGECAETVSTLLAGAQECAECPEHEGD